MKRLEIKIAFGALAASVVLLAALWGFLAHQTIYHKPGIGKAPYNSEAK